MDPLITVLTRSEMSYIHTSQMIITKLQYCNKLPPPTRMSAPFDPKTITDRPRYIGALIDDDVVFWNIIDALSIEFSEDGYGLFANRTVILKAYREGNLYIQSVEETDDDYRTGWAHTHGWGVGSGIILPTFCVYQDGAVELIWTAKHWRRTGVASHFVKHFNVTEVDRVVPASLGFWDKVGVRANIGTKPPQIS